MYAAILPFAGWLGRCASNTSPFFTHTGLILLTLHDKKTFYHKSRLTKYVPFSRRNQFGVTTLQHVTIQKLNTPVRPNISQFNKWRKEEELTR
jgi:hypothetical protein